MSTLELVIHNLYSQRKDCLTVILVHFVHNISSLYFFPQLYPIVFWIVYYTTVVSWWMSRLSWLGWKTTWYRHLLWAPTETEVKSSEVCCMLTAWSHMKCLNGLYRPTTATVSFWRSRSSARRQKKRKFPYKTLGIKAFWKSKSKQHCVFEIMFIHVCLTQGWLPIAAPFWIQFKEDKIQRTG